MYFSGFALRDEAHFFNAFLDDGQYVLSGFSYGAIKAFKEAMKSSTRVDKLQLISPAFFQSKGAKFKRLQLMGYQKNSDAYLAKFTENCFLPYGVQNLSYTEHNVAQLEELLTYEWSEAELQTLVDRGTVIEVYLGGQDKISDVGPAYAFFLPFATVTLIKGANHFLQGK
ncbi:MAG: pimelyl-ACP methyl ester esterase BioV [Sulfurimonadaceae bacterium]